MMVKILKRIYADNTVGPILGFKGGTAAYIFYDLPRFSVDLDFDLLESKKEDYVFERIGEIIKKYGKIKDRQKKHYTLFFELSYGAKDRNIKIEINRRSFGSKYEVKSYYGIPIKVMVQEDMAANKIVAIYERMERVNRDFFDVWFFLEKGWPINKKLVEQRLAMPYKDFLKKCIAKIEKLTKRSILEGMGELLDAKQKIWAKENLKDDLIFLLKLALDNEE